MHMKMSSKRQKANLNWTKHIFFLQMLQGSQHALDEGSILPSWR